MIVRTRGVTGMPRTYVRSIRSDWWTTIPGMRCRDGAMTSIGCALGSSSSCRIAAERCESTAPGPQASTAARNRPSRVSFVCPTA